MKKFFRITLALAATIIVLQGCQSQEAAPEVVQQASTTDTAPALPIPATLVSQIEDARIPTVALDAKASKVYTAFFRDVNEVTGVFVAQRGLADTAWEPAVQINALDDKAGAHSQAPAQIVVGPEGNVYVVWTNSIEIEGRRFPASNLLISRSVDGGRTFSPQQAINTDADGYPAGHTFHDVTVADDGTLYVSWLDSRERYRARAKLSDHAVATPIRKVAMGGHNAKMSHKAHMHEPGTQVWVAHSTDGGQTFSEGTVVAKETCQCCRTSVMAAPGGNVYVAWRHIFPGTQRDMAIAHSADGGKTFAAPRRIFADEWRLEGCPHTGPSIAVDADGQFHAAWYTGQEERVGLYYSTADDGEKAFESPVKLAGEVGVSQVQLSGSGTSRIWAAWEDKNAKGIRVAFAEAGGALNITDEFMAGHSLPAIDSADDTVIIASQTDGVIHFLQQQF